MIYKQRCWSRPRNWAHLVLLCRSGAQFGRESSLCTFDIQVRLLAGGRRVQIRSRYGRVTARTVPPWLVWRGVYETTAFPGFDWT